MNYYPPPVLKTERLILRPITPEDAKDAFVWLSDERVNKFMPYNLYKNKDEVLHWINDLIPAHVGFQWGFALKESNTLIGSGGVSFKEKENAWMIGYNIRFDCWNMGYTTEAAQRMIKFAYDELGARDFCSEHAVDNPASGKVMEKCGLKFERNSEYSTFDGSQTFKAKFYTLHLD